MIRKDYTFICALCGTSEIVMGYNIYDKLKEHRRKHYDVLKGTGESVCVFFDPSDETDSWFNMLLTWKLNRPKESDGAEDT